MARLSECERADILRFQDEARDALKDCASLQEAAQRLTDSLWNTFADSLILVRCFATIPFIRLPPADRAFVERIADARQAYEPLADDTLVLSLLGTRGSQSAWNDRSRSQGHLGIPLISAAFVDAIPMVARLLRELGVDPGWPAVGDEKFVEHRLSAGEVGIFYVPEAASDTDAQGRRVISAQGFVEENGVQTVFGLGGVYSDGTIPVLLFFTNERLEKETVERYVHLISLMKAATAELTRKGAFFSA